MHATYVRIASAWLTARPGFTELTAIESCVNARLRLGKILLAGQHGDAASCSRRAGGRHNVDSAPAGTRQATAAAGRRPYDSHDRDSHDQGNDVDLDTDV